MSHSFNSLKLSLATALLFVPVISFASAVPVFDWVAAYNSTGVNAATVKALAIDLNDGSVVTGTMFTGAGVDLDPSGDADLFSAVGGNDAFITKYSADGTYQWSRTWGGSGTDTVVDTAILSDGTIVAVGQFANTVDFDPDLVATSYATTTGSDDIFISFFDAEGTYQSTRTFGGTASDGPRNVYIVDDVLYVTGTFNGTIDLDPDSVATTYATSSGGLDVFVSKFSSDGIFEWGKGWGGTGYDSPLGSSLTIDTDSSVVLGTFFQGTSDFDPGPGTSNLVSNGSFDIGISKFTSDGTFVWAKGWGGTGSEFPGGVASDSQNNIYVQAYFDGTVDFDPDPLATSYATSNGLSDISLSKFSPDGTFEWVKAYGGTASDAANNVFVDEAGNLLLLGDFKNTVDFDPGVGVSNFTSTGGREVFIQHLTLDGDYIGTRTFGGTLDEWIDQGQLVSVSGEETLSIVGVYKSAPTDFDPSFETANFSSDGNDMYLAVFNLIEASVDVSPTEGSLDEAEENSFTYDLVLTAPPTDDVVITITPDTQITTDLSEVTFASTTWDVPQTVTVTVVNDSLEEGTPHTGTITHTSSSDDIPFDDMTIDDVVATITENDVDHDGSSSGGSRSSSGSVPSSLTPSAPDSTLTPTLIPTTFLTPEEKEILIAEIKVKLTALIQELIKILQAQLAELLAKEAE